MICDIKKFLLGTIKGIYDCDQLKRFTKGPPCNIHSWGGNHPKVSLI